MDPLTVTVTFSPEMSERLQKHLDSPGQSTPVEEIIEILVRNWFSTMDIPQTPQPFQG